MVIWLPSHWGALANTMFIHPALMIGIVVAAYAVFAVWICWPREVKKGDWEEKSRKEKILTAIMGEVEAMIDEVAGRGEHR